MDFVVSGHSAPKAPARRGKKAAAKRFAWLKFLGRRPARTVLGAAFSAVLVGIAINALFFQTARHPAPLFGAPAAPDVKRQTAVPAPPVRPVEIAQSTSAAAPQNILPAAAQKPAPAARDSAEAAKLQGDQIAALLRGNGIVSSGDAEKNRIQSAQRALIKLGYSVRADGSKGSSTRQAIEKFERDRNLPITGELGAKTVRELAAQSRIAIP